MRICSVEISNFRSIENATIEFDTVTTLVGPNGAGKSTVLHALDWFFNGPSKSILSEDDVYSGASEGSRRIQVCVRFSDLTLADRTALGEKYAPAGVDEFTAWRSWEAGEEKITGKALAYPPSEEVRGADGMKAKRAALENARTSAPDHNLPPWTTIAGTEAAMDAWERGNPERLEEARVSSSHLFGFYGQGKLSGLFDYVLVSADLRAAEESADGRDTIVGKILEKAIDRTEAQSELTTLLDAFRATQVDINDRLLLSQLSNLAAELSAKVEELTVGRAIALTSLPIEVRPQPPRVSVSVLDGSVETAVNRQGHGFQRALLLAALQVLAKHGSAASDGSAVCLAIEEPELYQHPTQARALASVLRALAEDAANGVQVAYATHSPYFVEPRYFDQVRRVTRRPVEGSAPKVRVSSASIDSVCARLAGFESEQAVRSRWDQICLKNLAEAFFADGVILVEGDGDKAILEGASGEIDSLALAGVAVAAANGKTKMLIPHAILAELEINTLLVFDNDSGCRERMTRQGKDATEIGIAEITIQDQNRKLMQYFGLPVADYPVGLMPGNQVVALDDTMESMLEKDWPEWEATRVQLVRDGRGAGGKNAATYALAARECPTPPQGLLAQLLGVAIGG